MGYEVHITRKTEWFAEDGPVLSLEDWLAYVGSDSEMRPDGYAEATTPKGETLRTENPGIAVWTAYSGHGLNGNMAWFCHFQDRVTVKNPDAEILRTMHSIATSLGARVQGDEGEEYGADGKEKQHASEGRSVTSSGKKPWWQFW